MSDKKLSLTHEQLRFVMEQTELTNPREALEYFAELMKKENINVRMMPEVVEKMMDRQRKALR